MDIWLRVTGEREIGIHIRKHLDLHNLLPALFQVWKNNDFVFELKKPGYVKGFIRRFYQNSIDHRGIPEKPGRVVTLVKTMDEESRVYGMGYKIPDDKIDEVLSHLDYREKNGYNRYETTFYPLDESDPKATIVYVANEQNPSWNKNQNLNAIATQIYTAHGPSGRNIEYVYNLCDAMRKNFKDLQDDHLFELENLLRDMELEDVKRNPKLLARRSSKEG